MVYKFRSLIGYSQTLKIRDVDGDEVTVEFQKIDPVGGKPYGLFETEDDKIGQAMLRHPDNGVKYMDQDYVKRLKEADAAKKVSKKRETQAVKDAPKRTAKPAPTGQVKNRRSKK